MSFSSGFPGLLERSKSNGMPPFQQSLSDKANYQEFEREISDVLDSALIECMVLARAWVPCVQNRKCRGGLFHRNSVFVFDVKCGSLMSSRLNKDLACTFFHMERGEGIVGKAFMINQAFVTNRAFVRDPLRHITLPFGLQCAAIAVPLRSSIHNSECVFEFVFTFFSAHIEQIKKKVTALFSTLKQCCRTLRVVADKVFDEPSYSTFLAFPSLQPLDTVEQSVAKDSLIQKENQREADPKRGMQLLPESSDQNERCPDPTPRIEPAKTCDAIGLGSLAASETSEERHATGEKTVNVPDISLNDSAKSTGANLNPRSSSLLPDVPALEHFDTVELSVASDSLFLKENSKEADPKHVMQLLPESSDQNEKCPDPRPRHEPAETFDDISLGSLAANETSEERHATGEKTVNVPNISLNDSVKITGVAGRSTGGCGSKRDSYWKNLEQILVEAQNRWLRPTEICEILRNHQKLHLAPDPPVRPPAGSLFLFDRKALRYFGNDGHRWRKKKDGKTVKEAHEKLKAGSVDVLHCYCAHAEENENFQRQSYWMLDRDFEHIVFVHYREVKEGYKSGISRLLASPRSQVERPQNSLAPCPAQTSSPVPTGQTSFSPNPNRVDWSGQKLSSEFEDKDSGENPGTSSLTHRVFSSTSHDASLLSHDSAKSTGVAGTSTGGAGSKRDWAWKYCSSIPGNSNGVICSFCDLQIKGGGITRFKSHISGSDPNKNVKKCENVPPEVKAEIDQKGKKRR